MRVVFLDFDGVIATSSSYRNAPYVKVQQEWGGEITVWSNPAGLLVPSLVENVQTLCDVAEAAIVIASDWRTQHPIEDLASWLRGAGLVAPILGGTPKLNTTRGQEILTWMHENGRDVKDIIILEDERDVSPFRNRQIQTTFGGPHQGFTKRHLSRALRLWGLELPTGSNITQTA